MYNLFLLKNFEKLKDLDYIILSRLYVQLIYVIWFVIIFKIYVGFVVEIQVIVDKVFSGQGM